MTHLPWALLGLSLLQEPVPAVTSDEPQAAEASAATAQPYVLERGTGLVPLRVPRGERLDYRATVSIGPVHATVGEVTLESDVEAYKPPLLLGGEGEGPVGDTAWMRARAAGDYTLYSMDATIETRILPQEWPHLLSRHVHEGTENRRREVQVGWLDGKRASAYRKATRNGAPRGTRIWRNWAFREVPEPTLDMLSGVYLVRTMIEDDVGEVRFPLIDKDRLWDMKLTRGERKHVETRAGTFDAVEIVLHPSPHEGEPIDPDKVEKFEGLFGLHGSIHLWVCARTGVPVRIQGDLPVGPLTLRIDVELKGYAGTPADFAPAGAAAAAGAGAAGD